MINREFFKKLYQFNDPRDAGDYDCCECCNNEVFEDNKQCKECLQCEDCGELECECEKCRCGKKTDGDYPLCKICLND